MEYSNKWAETLHESN